MTLFYIYINVCLSGVEGRYIIAVVNIQSFTDTVYTNQNFGIVCDVADALMFGVFYGPTKDFGYNSFLPSFFTFPDFRNQHRTSTNNKHPYFDPRDHHENDDIHIVKSTTATKTFLLIINISNQYFVTHRFYWSSAAASTERAWLSTSSPSSSSPLRVSIHHPKKEYYHERSG